MLLRLTGLTVLAALAAGGCTEPLEGDPCTAAPYTEVSKSGDTFTTSTGLRYIEQAPGEGTASFWCATVAVHYDGFLTDGTSFDSSRDGSPLVFVPGQGKAIAGFEQGVVG